MKLAIVDDNEIEQEIILNTLDVYSKEHSVHFEIETFSDGGSFLGAYQSVDYDLVFMDFCHFQPSQKVTQHAALFQDCYCKCV